MSTFAWVVIITTIAGVVGTGLGGLIGAVVHKNSEKLVSLLLSFAGGVMVCVVCLDLLLDALEEGKRANGTLPVWHVFMVIGMVLVGYVLVYLLNYIIDKRTNKQIKHIDQNHPKTADQLSELIHSDHYEVHKEDVKKHNDKASKMELFVAGLVMAFAIALHNLPEGMVIGASYANEPIISGLSSGLTVAIVIGLHNIPEGMSVSVPLIAGGTNKAKAVFATALTGVPTVLGAMMGYFIGTLNPLALSLSLSFASGAMLYVVFGELMPEAILMWRSKAPGFAMLVGLLVGILILFIG
ncbi:MAG: ZIP family metal transporter [Candidatus Coproplasma sp.]